MFTLTYCLDPHLEKKIVKFSYTTHLVHRLLSIYRTMLIWVPDHLEIDDFNCHYVQAHAVVD